MKTKPVAIFRHSAVEGPGYFATFLDAHSLPHCLIAVDEGMAMPASAMDFAGLCFMGGPMSVNDDLPWIPQALTLIREAVQHDIPVIGHCLGGQLMAKALGGTVARNPVKELGWGAVRPCQSTLTAAWLQVPVPFDAFHWHGETFSIPPGATCILESDFCAHQAFVQGPHLGMQCHVEMTPAMIRQWCETWAQENASPGPSVQTPAQMLAATPERITPMRQVADRLYGHWVRGLKP